MEKKETVKKTFLLNGAGIDAISEEVTAACSLYGTDSKTATRFRLSVEDSLGTWQKELGEDKEVTFETGRRLTRPYFRISIPGYNCNPYNNQSDDFGNSQKGLLARIGLVPVFLYRNGRNILTFNIPKKKMNPVLNLMLVILAAVIIGVLGKVFVPAESLDQFLNGILIPIEDVFFNVLSCIAGPLIFCSVAWGVYGIGDVYTLGRVGKKMMLDFVKVVAIFGALGVALYPILGNGISASSEQTNQFDEIFQMVLGIFPANIFSPFIDGNILQIIFLALVIGIAIIFLGQRTEFVATVVEQINYIISFLMEFISKMIPAFVFIVLLELILSGSLSTFASVWKFALVFIGASFVLMFLFILAVSLRRKTSPFRMIKNCLPTYLIALTTASSAAAFESNMSICKKKLGISDSMASFGVPLGMVMFKPNTALYYLLFCFYLSSVYDVQVSVSWIVVAFVVTVISAVATPPIPGGSTVTYTILFTQLGIPTSAVAVALAVDIIFDFLMTSGDMLTLLVELFDLSHKTGMREIEKPGKQVYKV